MKSTLLRPVITEKSLTATSGRWFTFRAVPGSRKEQLKTEIETLYGVTVVAIRTAVMPGKTRRAGRKARPVTGNDWKKVWVQLKPDQTIDAFQIGGTEEKK